MIPAAVAILRKDLTVELRTRESVPAMALFSVVVFVLFHFGLDRNEIEGSLASGVLWVTLLLAAVLGVSRLAASESEGGAVDGLLLAPIDRTAVYLAKATALFLYIVALELVALPAFAILLLGPSPWSAVPELVLVLALANVGIAVIGTLVGALAVQSRARELIAPLLSLPLLVPLLIAAARATAPLLADGGAGPLEGRWLLVLALYDAVFGLIAYAVFDYLLEE